MKNFFRLLRILWTKKRRTRDAQIQRFELLEHELRCCLDFHHLDQFDSHCDVILTVSDKASIRYDLMMARRFSKEKAMCRNENEMRWARIHEGDHLLSRYK
jgi:hypothetical protein